MNPPLREPRRRPVKAFRHRTIYRKAANPVRCGLTFVAAAGAPLDEVCHSLGVDKSVDKFFRSEVVFLSVPPDNGGMNNYEDGVAYWCDKHEHYSTGWRWEDQADKWLCGSCYQEFWDNENEELG